MLISECLFDVLSFPKTNTKIWQISALEYKSDEINKIKALSYSVIIYILMSIRAIGCIKNTLYI